MLSDLSLQRLAGVHPELARRVKNLAAALEAEDIPIEVDTALRTSADQDALYRQGRTLPGIRVTNAHGYQSNHVIGCAVDISPVDPITNRPDWNASHPCWRRIVELAPKYGLRDGVSWHDLPHLELEEIPPEPADVIQQICKAEGVRAAWDTLKIPTLITT